MAPAPRGTPESERERRAALRHELRTPLNAVIGFAELLAAGRVTDAATQAEYAGEILKSARRLLGMIDALVGPTGPGNHESNSESER